MTPATEMDNGQLLNAFERAYYNQDQGYTKEDEQEAARYDEYRAELLRRLLPKAGDIDAVRESGTCPYVCFEGGEVCLDGYFTLDQLKLICAELAK